MKFKIEISIEAESEQEARRKGASMSDASGLFTAKEWMKIAQKLKNKIIQIQIRSMI